MGSRILLADDSITIQKVVNLTFADEGIEVVAVSNGEMAERRLNEVSPDLVLADIFMPGKNGYELCQAVKTNPRFRNVPVVLLVGAFEPFDQAEARRVHADAHLTKPFESRTLVETVRKLIGKTDRPRTGPIASTSPDESEPVSPVEEHHTFDEAALVAEPFSVDFESAPGEWTPIDNGTSDAGAQSTLRETSPFEASQVSSEDALRFHSVEVEAASESLDDKSELSALPWERSTGELVSVGYPDAAEAAGLVKGDPRTSDGLISSFEAATNATEAHGLPTRWEGEAQARTSDTPSAFGLEPQKMVVDFEEYLPSKPREDDEPSMFDVDAPTPHTLVEQEASADEWHVEEVEQPTPNWQFARDLNTTMLEMPASKQSSTEAHDEPGDRFSFLNDSAGNTESSILLTGDEPLGDVLLDDGASDSVAGEPANASATALEASPLNEFDLEFSGEAARHADAETLQQSTQARTTGELITAELPLDGRALVDSAAQSFEASKVLETPVNEHVIDEVEHSVESSPSRASSMDSVVQDWTSPSPVVYSTAQLDSTAMPVEFMEPSDKSGPEADEPVPSVLGSAVEESATWDAEQMHFAAIDVAVSPVEAERNPAGHSHLLAGERGFEISQVATEQTGFGRVTDARRRATDEPIGPIEFSPMVIDEIVRRVVAQIGDSVVREIAWEIVPDCVERIIEQQTRESLSKR